MCEPVATLPLVIIMSDIHGAKESWGWRRGGVGWERAQIRVSRVLMMSPVNNNTLI